MHNLINKFEAEVSSKDDAGVVAIEYVILAGVVAIAVAALGASGALGALGGKLADVIDTI